MGRIPSESDNIRTKRKERLKNVLKEVGLTQNKLADLMDSSPQNVSRYFSSSKSAVSLTKNAATRIADAINKSDGCAVNPKLQVSAEYLLCETDNRLPVDLVYIRDQAAIVMHGIKYILKKNGFKLECSETLLREIGASIMWDEIFKSEAFKFPIDMTGTVKLERLADGKEVKLKSIVMAEALLAIVRASGVIVNGIFEHEERSLIREEFPADPFR